MRGAAVALTPTEWGVLVALATVPGRVYSRFELINRVRGYEFEGYERTVDSHVKNLRRKVEDTLACALQFENGAFGVIMGSTAMYPGSAAGKTTRERSAGPESPKFLPASRYMAGTPRTPFIMGSVTPNTAFAAMCSTT